MGDALGPFGHRSRWIAISSEKWRREWRYRDRRDVEVTLARRTSNQRNASPDRQVAARPLLAALPCYPFLLSLHLIPQTGGIASRVNRSSCSLDNWRILTPKSSMAQESWSKPPCQVAYADKDSFRPATPVFRVMGFCSRHRK